MLTAWSDKDSSSSLEDEVQEIANLCLMEKEESKVSDSDYSSDCSDDKNENSSTFRTERIDKHPRGE